MTAADIAVDARRSRSIIAILLVAAFVLILNETTINVALTSIMADLDVVERTAQWLTTAFMLTMAVVIPVTGWLLERLPTRTVFKLSLGLFSFGTLICLIAPVFGVLLAGRIVQASGTAIMMPLLMTTIMQMVPPSGRGRVMGNISLVISVAPAVGPTMSGLLLHLGSWRLIFGVVLPIAVGVALLGHLVLQNVGEDRATPLDAISVPLSLVAFGPLVYGMSLIGAAGTPAWEPAAALGLGAVGVAAFVLRQLRLQRRDRALLDLRTFTYPAFTIALVMMALATMALFGTIITLPLVLQRSFGLEALQVGLMMLPGGFLMGVLGPLVGRLFDRFGPRPLVIPASIVVTGVFVFFSTLTLATPWWAVMIGHIVMSMSFAFVFTPLFTVALGALPNRLYSHGSATVGTVQQVAGAAGTALFVTVMAMQTEAAEAAGTAHGAALLVGTHWSFLGAGAVWTVGLVSGFFLRRPQTTAEPLPSH